MRVAHARRVLTGFAPHHRVSAVTARCAPLLSRSCSTALHELGATSRRGAGQPQSDVLAKVPPDLAEELLYEVGWNARHRFLDVRAAQTGGAVRGAIHVPLLPEVHSFEARAMAALHEPNRSRLGGSEDLKAARIIVGCEDDDAEDAKAAAVRLKNAGFLNTVLLEGGFNRWRSGGHPLDIDLGDGGGGDSG